MKFTHDVIVIGGGAAGLVAAGGCALFGLEVALIEGRKMGGECLNDGCVPSKALITAAKRAAEAREGTRYGVTLDQPQVDWLGVRQHIRDAIAAIEPHDSEDRFEEMGCEVIRDWAKVTGPQSVEVGGRTLRAPRIVIATGSKPAIPPIEGVDSVPYLTNETIFDIDALPDHLVIVGGGVIGMEMAQAFRRLGSAVTVVEPDELMARDDRESVALVREVMEGEGVRFVKGLASKVEGRDGAIRLHVGEEVIDGSHLLIATGRKARCEGFGLEDIGVKMGRGGIVTDERRRTSVKGIYAIGDCRDGPRLTHVSGYEGSNVALEITLGLPAKVDYSALPWCTYTEPEVAQIGLTEQEAREKYGEKLRVVIESFHDNERALTEGNDKGQAKVMLKGTKVVGASLVGKNVGELLLPYTQTITGKSSTFALGSAVIAYPTRSEITKATAFAAWEPTVFGPLPKKWAGFQARMRRRFS
ncbi:dihydrolipoyl dehydrogenase family protein [Qipengyuania gaetbuli]|uniref:dihydrolipoyl dehydrogenase family protein n=1 Tax=Qipengyuania gaetbuli TaxID=266952 RepID=UPI001CD44834|nr:FAD-dependent oxidoreductase [Qipengyuania gaetbuli]MCA0910553.1 FAD-dependent oxidoreductase [Qipengyuania gaetbuli]